MSDETSPELARMEISVYPLGTGKTSVSEEVSRIFDVLDTCGLTYETSIMGTTVEGTADELFGLARELHSAVLDGGAGRVVTVMKVDERR